MTNDDETRETNELLRELLEVVRGLNKRLDAIKDAVEEVQGAVALADASGAAGEIEHLIRQHLKR